MKALIRWSGLVSFTLLVALTGLIILVFLDYWIKLAAQSSLSETTGAEVNIASVQHSFSPFGITLNHIQLTDPKAPATNQLEARSIAAKIDLAPLLLRKLVVDDLTIVGLQFGTTRDSEGQVYRLAEQQESDIESIFGDVKELPSVDEILAKSPLKTTQAIQDTQRLYEKHNESLQQQYAALPNKEKLSQYKQRITLLTATDYKDPLKLLEAKKEFDGLKQQILADKKQISGFKEALSEAKQEFVPQLAQLKSAPGQDYDLLQSLITGDGDAIQDVTTLVFGEKIGKWSQYALAAFEVAAPMLSNEKPLAPVEQSSAGQWLNFSDNSSIPDFWIKQAKVSIQWQQENIVSVWKDITHQHDVLGRPTLFSVDSAKSSLWQSLKLEGDLWLSGSATVAQQNWTLKGLKLSAIELLNQEQLSSKLDQGLLTSSGQVALYGETVTGASRIDLQQLTMTATGTNKLTNLVAKTLNQLSQLQIDTTIDGTLGDLDLSFSSDLNQQIGSALLTSLGPDKQAKLDELQQKLNQHAKGALGDNNNHLHEWLSLEKLAQGDMASLNTLLGAKLDGLVDQQKDKLKDKIFKKLFK
jgi:uncharacterized protein (TIGR03545 family)